MNFFRKRTPDSAAQPAETPAGELPAGNADCTPEERARQWFEARFGTEMPEEITRLFRRIAQTEAKRQKVGESVLTDTEQRNLQEQIRLCRTKLTNIAQTLAGLQAQKEWLIRNQMLKSTEEKYKQAAYESQKRYNERLTDIRELERYENFESVQDDFRQIKMLETLLQSLRTEASELLRSLERLQAECREAEQRKLTEDKHFEERKADVMQMQADVAEGYRMQTERRLLDLQTEELAGHRAATELALAEVKEQADEAESELKKAEEQYARLGQLQQELAPQQKMLEQGEVILTQLDFLQGQTSRLKELQTALERARKQQQEQNEKLNKLFARSQDTDAEIKKLQGQLEVHRRSILGMNSYNLQQRAMNLKSKKEQLTGAISLWKQISEGYALTDEKSQEITRMRHHNESLKSQIATLETEVAGLQTQCDELNYAYTLSKSQDVMQLRKDLREGTNCSVCGATHHPYHSDTLLEQSKLIGELKTELEHASTELKHKRAQLDELRQEQATEEGRIATAYQWLEIYKQSLQENVSHWADFATLDRSLHDCSPSSNFDGRRILLQQLMEKTSVDAEAARAELETFNQHQAAINAINEQLNLRETERGELAVRLNEVNTGCQVGSYRVEQLQQDAAHTNEAVCQLHEEIDRVMTVSNWHKVWSENPETLKIYIRRQMEQWRGLKEDLTENAHKRARLQERIELTERHRRTLKREAAVIAEKTGKAAESKKHIEQQLGKLFGHSNADNRHREALEALLAAEERKTQAAEAVAGARAEAAQCEGRRACVTEAAQRTEEQMAGKRAALDFWMRKYNADHSPVQMAELEHTFGTQTDRNALREEIRTLTLNKMLAEARAEEARLAVAAHQVNALSQGDEKEDRTAALNAEIARLESEQGNILTRIASCRAQLEAHEHALQRLAAGDNETAGQP